MFCLLYFICENYQANSLLLTFVITCNFRAELKQKIQLRAQFTFAHTFIVRPKIFKNINN